MLYQNFKSFIAEHRLFEKEDKILLTVSGGIDSMVMLRLFHRLGMKVAVAHCNFQLRGEESDGDELFVRKKAAELNIPIFVTRFETEEYASENQLSIQMAARELRYSWFKKLAKVHQFKAIAVAHNRDDAMETFFINLGRGTGISGLTGIRPSSGNLVRPLLFASRKEIESYATENYVPYREDSSNSSDKYLRNFIRHQVIPQFEGVFARFRQSMPETLHKLTDAHELYQYSVQEWSKKIVITHDEVSEISIPVLKTAPAPKTILFEILKNDGFSSLQVEEIYSSLDKISGKKFFSSTHLVLKDRDKLIVSKLPVHESHRFYIEQDTKIINHPIGLEFDLFERPLNYTIDKQSGIALLDAEKISFPLILRKWQSGDYFIPLGMKGMKKISDFFIDKKLSLIEKQKIWILTSGDQVVWIVGQRLDDRFKITDESARILKISLIPAQQ